MAIHQDAGKDPTTAAPGPDPHEQGPQASGSAKSERGKPRGWRRLLRFCLRLCLKLVIIVPVLLLILYGTRERTLHPLLVRIAPPIARMAAGLDLRLDDIDGDWRSGLVIKGLEVRRVDGQPLGVLASLRASEASVEGHLIGFARDLTRLDLIQGIRLVQPEIRLDLAAPREAPEDSGPLRIPALPRLTVDDGRLEVALAAETLRFEGIAIDGSATDAAPLTVQASAAGSDWSARIDASVIRASESSVTFVAAVPEASARGVSMTLADLTGAWSPTETSITRGTLTAGNNYLTPENVVLRSGTDGLEAGGRIAFDLEDVGDAHRVACSIRGVEDTDGWSGQLSGTIDLTPMAGQIATGSVSISGSQLFAAGVELGTVTGLATADERGFYLHELLCSDGSGSQLRGSGTLLADFKTLEGVEVTLQLDHPGGLHESLKAARDLRAELTLSGDLNHPTGTVVLRADAVEAGGRLLRDVTADGALQDGVLTLSDVQCKTEFGEANASASVTLPLNGKPLDLTLETFGWANAGEKVTLAQPVPIHLADGEVRIEGLVLSSGDGRAELSLDSATDEGLALDLKIVNLQLEPFLKGLPDSENLHFGALHGEATLRTKGGKSQGARGSINLTLDRSSDPKAAPVRAHIQADWTDGLIAFRDVVVELDAAQLQIAGSAPLLASATPLGPGKVDLQLRISADALTLTRAPVRTFLGAEARALVDRASGRAFANVQLSGAWNALRGTLKLDLEEARLLPADGRKPLLPEALSGSLAIKLGEALTLGPSSVQLGQIAKAQVSGTLAQSLDATALLEDPAARVKEWQAAAMDVQGDLDFESLDWLARFLPELRETRGALSGTVAVKGSVKEPIPTGRLVLKNGGARYRGLPPLENAQVEVTMKIGQLSIDRADFEIGASPVSIRGTVLHDQEFPRIDATITGTEVLLARSADARIRADLNLTLTGRTNELTVGGDVLLAGGRIRSPIEFQSLLSGGSTGPQSVRRGIRIPAFGPDTLKLNLNVTTSEPLSLRGRIARGKIRADLRLLGTAAQPTPIGQVFFDPLELAVPAGTINFPTGLIRFDPDSPDIPRIDLVGTTRLAGYDITVNVDGDYDEPNVELSSSPPLAPEDLLLLVLSGQPPSSGGGIEAAGQSVALYVAKDLVRGWFSSGGFDDEDKESFLDRLEVTTGRDVSRSGTLTLEATYKLREGLARKRDAIYVVLERDAYEDYGLGLRFVLRLR